MGVGNFRPLAGCGLFLALLRMDGLVVDFRPLAGCGLFPQNRTEIAQFFNDFRPLAGCGLFHRSAGGR